MVLGLHAIDGLRSLDNLSRRRFDPLHGPALPSWLSVARAECPASRQIGPAIDGTTFLAISAALAANTPRFSWHAGTGKLGLLVEPARTNNAWRSRIIDANVDHQPDGWLVSAGVAGTAYTVIPTGGPDGGPVLQLEDVATLHRGAYYDLNAGGGALAALTQYASSIWTRRTGAGGAGVISAHDLNPGTANFTLAAGPHDWTRLFTLGTTVGVGRFAYMAANGDPPGIVQMRLLQIEPGKYASSYIPIAGDSDADATRAAELATMNAAELAGGKTAGATFIEVSPHFDSTVALDGAWTIKEWAPGWRLDYDPTDDLIKLYVAGVLRCTSPAQSWISGDVLDLAVHYGPTGTRLVQDGAVVDRDTNTWGDPGATFAPFLGSRAASANCEAAIFLGVDERWAA